MYLYNGSLLVSVCSNEFIESVFIVCCQESQIMKSIRWFASCPTRTVWGRWQWSEIGRLLKTRRSWKKWKESCIQMMNVC